MTTKYIEAKAYLLHYKPYRNTSLLATFLTETHGLVKGVMRGAQKKGFSAFTPYWLQFESKEGLSNITRFERLGATKLPVHKRLFCGLYINELVVRLGFQYDINPSFFSDYETATLALYGQSSLETVLREVESALLQAIGYELTFDVDMETGERIEASVSYHFYPDKGFVKRAGNKPGDLAISGEEILAIGQENYESTAVRQKAKAIMRAMFDYLLAGKTINSRQLFIDV